MTTSGRQTSRRVFMVLSPRSLIYAKYALGSLLKNALETLDLHLITDSASDKERLVEEMTVHQNAGRHKWTVHTKNELDEREAEIFARHSHLRLFRNGHPCWRKITDPLLLTTADEEMVVLDPDLYFPNRFTFEPTPAQGLLLMWQRPSCLFPAGIVDTALRSNVALAHHVDIGVAQWRSGADLDWLDWLIARLKLEEFPQARSYMHVEAIVWAAIAMRVRGGYLPPAYWHCWLRSQKIRLLRKVGVPGPRLIRSEPFATIKCFHATAESKYWLEAAKQKDWLASDNVLDKPGTILPFVEWTTNHFRRDQAIKLWVRKSGYYHLFPSGGLQ